METVDAASIALASLTALQGIAEALIHKGILTKQETVEIFEAAATLHDGAALQARKPDLNQGAALALRRVAGDISLLE